LSGFVLKEIETDKITMVRGEEKLIVAMNDPQKAKAREVAAVTTAAAPAAQPKATPAATPAQRQRESRKPAAVSQAPAPAEPRVSQPQATPPQQPSPATISGAPAVRPDFKKEAGQIAPNYRPSGGGGGLLFPNR